MYLFIYLLSKALKAENTYSVQFGVGRLLKHITLGDKLVNIHVFLFLPFIFKV